MEHFASLCALLLMISSFPLFFFLFPPPICAIRQATAAYQPSSAFSSIRGRAKELSGCHFEILGALDAEGGTAVIKGCKTNARRVVVQGAPGKIVLSRSY